jgi:hypothetical protein
MGMRLRAAAALNTLRTSMTRLTFRRRALSAALLLFHVVVVGLLVPAADARLERAAGDGVVHVEAEGSATCPPGHDHLHCQFCQQLGIRLLATPLVQREPAPRIARTARVASAPVFVAVGIFLPLGSRAPPLA